MWWNVPAVSCCFGGSGGGGSENTNHLLATATAAAVAVVPAGMLEITASTTTYAITNIRTAVSMMRWL